MNRKEEKKIEKLGIAIIAIFTFLLVINSLTPLMGEDITLTAFPKNYQTANIREFFLLMTQRIYEQMTNWNIRIGEQLSILFSCFDKNLFNICNSIVSLSYVWLVYQWAFKRKFISDKRNILYLLFIFAMILMFQPVLGEIFFWRTGSTNYLWGICILLGFSLPLRYYIGHQPIDIVGSSPKRIVLLSICGFLAGFTNENTVIVILFLYIGVIIFDKKANRKTPIWVYCSGVALLIGFVCMYKAPSTANRIAYYNEMYGFDNIGFRDYVDRAEVVIETFFSKNMAFIAGTIIILLLYIITVVGEKGVNNIQKLEKLRADSEAFGLLILASISCGALVMSPYVETRSFLLADFFMLMSMIYYLDKILDKFVIHEMIISKIICVGSTVCCICFGTSIYNTYYDYYNFTKLRESAVELTNKNETFFWGVYMEETSNSRILTTREDYLIANEDVLSTYYDKKIKCWGNCLWNLDTSGYSIMETLGGIDAVTYDKASDTVYIWGWGAFKEKNADNSKCYVYIDTGLHRYYFRTGKSERNDIAQTLNNRKYLNCGFSAVLGNIHEWTGNESELVIGLSIIDEKGGYANAEVSEQRISIG